MMRKSVRNRSGYRLKRKWRRSSGIEGRGQGWQKWSYSGDWTRRIFTLVKVRKN